MNIKPIQLFGLALAGFAAIVVSQMLVQYRSDEAFRERFSAIDTSKLLKFRERLNKEEGISGELAVENPSEEISEEA